MQSQTWLLVFVVAGVATALGPAPHQTGEESLKSALDAVTRKQRSLDANSQEYYNDLHSFKYHGGGPDRQFERDRPQERELDEQDEEIEFLPNGQLETVGNGFQNLNNKLLERALVDYTENAPQQAETVPSMFRERERLASSSRKRGNTNVDNNELAKMFLEELQEKPSYGLGDLDDEEYLDTLQMLSDRYKAGRGGKPYEDEASMSRAMNNDLLSNRGDQERGGRYNARYPPGVDLKNYRVVITRYPITKRSPKPIPTKKQITDPKVAQDLGALFGTQSSEQQNHTHDHDHEHDHDHDHDHDGDHEREHNHDHDHDHDHDHIHDHNHDHDHGGQRNPETSSEAPKVNTQAKGQKENVTKVEKSKNIQLRKKSVDWSQYFGIDRRRKKATFMAGQGTQNQDDEWMLQRYYENMAENLKPTEQEYEKENTERKDKLEQMDMKLKNIKDLIIEEALRYADSKEGVDLQKVKDKVMARMAAAYSLEKIRKALNDLKNNVAAHLEAQKSNHAQSNTSSGFREIGNVGGTPDKRTSNNIDEDEGNDEMRRCPELEAIETHCKIADSLAGDGSQMLYLPCVMLQICKACDEVKAECLDSYAVEAAKICDAQVLREGRKGTLICANTAVILSQLQPPAAVAMQCRMNGNESCLRRYHYRYRHHYLRYPCASDAARRNLVLGLGPLLREDAKSNGRETDLN